MLAEHSPKAGQRAGDLQEFDHQWDVLGSPKTRERESGAMGTVEAFRHDGLNRLRTHQVGSGGSGRPHAVASVTRADNTRVTHAYDANGSNVSSRDGRTISYASIARDGHRSEFAHGPDRSRLKLVDTDGNGNGDATTSLYLGSVEKITHPDGTRQIRRHLDGLVIETLNFNARGNDRPTQIHYALRDHLGSVDVVADAAGNEVQAMGFDPWGKRRAAATWQGLADADIAALASGMANTTFRHQSRRMTTSPVGAFHLYSPSRRVASTTPQHQQCARGSGKCLLVSG